MITGVSYFPNRRKKKHSYDTMLEEVRTDWKRKYSKFMQYVRNFMVQCFIWALLEVCVMCKLSIYLPRRLP